MKARATSAAADDRPDLPAAGRPAGMLPLETSIGYQLRVTNRAMQRLLQSRIEPRGITPGMWYFLRALWEQDGLTQRELSLRAGTMEPTTLLAVAAMEKAGIVTRVRNKVDRRKINIFLTSKGRGLADELLPIAKDVIEAAVKGFSDLERYLTLSLLRRIQDNINTALGDAVEDASGDG